MINNEKEFNEYKNWFIEKWKPIIDKEREKSGNGYNAVRKNFHVFYDDLTPLYEYACMCYFEERNSSLADVKDFLK